MKIKSIILISYCFVTLLLSGIAHSFTWSDYKNKFISSDGRIIDYYQNQISHSEGQGYGLLLAMINDDKNYFDLIWKWTRNNLQLRIGDNLFCWSWGKRPNGQWKVIDYNNATDGDILIAWSLYLASKKWHNSNYAEESLKIIKSIRDHLSFKIDNKIVILPGYYGFVTNKGTILNPSYIILAAYLDFAQIDNYNYWQNAYETQKQILQNCQFGLLALPADWITLMNDGVKSKLNSKGVYFSYDAIRTFLYASWINDVLLKDSFDRLSNYFLRSGRIPEKIDLKRQYISLKEGTAGMYAVLGCYANKQGDKTLALKFFEIADKKIKYEKNDYYSSTLYLLAKYGAKWLHN